MTSILRNIWQIIRGRNELGLAPAVSTAKARPDPSPTPPSFEITPDDFLVDQESQSNATHAGDTWRTLTDFSLPSELGNEREAMRRVSQAVEELSLPSELLDRLKTAVAEATMNAMEHGNKNRPELPVFIQVDVSAMALLVRITDQGGGGPISEPEIPNLEAKLAGLQTPRGWGLFLIKKLMDEMRVVSNDTHHTIELILYLENANHVS
jgi:anti-sigma regulatory factor (Ser/Thr protein kinase)